MTIHLKPKYFAGFYRPDHDPPREINYRTTSIRKKEVTLKPEVGLLKIRRLELLCPPILER